MARPFKEEHCLLQKKKKRQKIKTKKKQTHKGQAENGSKCECLHRVTDLFGLLMAPPPHNLVERENQKVLSKVDLMRHRDNFHHKWIFDLASSLLLAVALL